MAHLKRDTKVRHGLRGDSSDYPTFKRVIMPAPIVPNSINSAPPANGASSTASNPSMALSSTEATQAARQTAPGINCRACTTHHPVGNCPLKIAGVEFCNLCGMAHYGHARVCPHIQSETQVSHVRNALHPLLTLRQGASHARGSQIFQRAGAFGQ